MSRDVIKRAYKLLYGRGGDGSVSYDKECFVCETKFTAKYPTAKYCSDDCSKIAYRERRIARNIENRTKECSNCEVTFVAKRSDAKYCSPACKQAAYRKRKNVTVTG